MNDYSNLSAESAESSFATMTSAELAQAPTVEKQRFDVGKFTLSNLCKPFGKRLAIRDLESRIAIAGKRGRDAAIQASVAQEIAPKLAEIRARQAIIDAI